MSLPAATMRYLCGIGPGDTGPSDADLLGRFIDRRDGAAFALLVRRHGDMVYGVCRRLLPTDQDAEDAFQATFLVLVEKAGTVAPRGAVGNWLFGVARRAALLARRSIARRRQRMTELTDLPAPTPDPLVELQAALDIEVSRLTDVLRTVIVLCDLEGRTRKEAASILGWPEGTVAGRLAQARRLLAKRLARHAPAVSVAAVLSATAARAPASVLALMTPGERQVPAAVATLTQAVLASLTGGKLMKTVIVVLVLGCAGLGMSLGAGKDKGTSPTPNAAGNAAVAEKPVKADPVVFWGEEVDGLKAGLSLVETPRIEKDGGSARLEVKFKLHIRNVGEAPVTINYGAPREDKPTVLDSAGDAVRVTMPPILFGDRPIYSRVIEPGKTLMLFDHELIVEVDAKQPLQSDVKVPTVRVPQGKYTISYSGMVSSHENLATGGLPLKVNDPGNPKAALPEEVAWGKEVGSLQAGLSLVETKTEQAGDTTRLKVKLEVKVRNVGKAPATITYGTPWERSPTITDAAGKEVPVRHSDFWIAPILIPVERVVEPGKTFSLSHPEITLEVDANQPVPKNITERTVRVLQGAYTISYDWVADSHKELATGGLPFRVMDPEKEPKADLVLSAPGRAQDEKLTVDRAKKLLPEAAGIRNADFKALSEDARPEPETIKSKSLSLVLLMLKPPAVKNPEADKEFRLFEDKPRPVSHVLEAMWISRDEGYASFIQPKYITDCECKSTADRAEGVVTFKSELFSGRIPFVARATKNGWVITEFRLSQYKTKVVRGADGLWKQEALPDNPGASVAPERTSESVSVRELQKERITTLDDIFTSSMALAKKGRGEFGEALDARMALLQAELEFAEQAADRVALYKKALDSIKELEQLAAARKAAAQGTERDVLRAKAKRLEIEIALARYN